MSGFTAEQVAAIYERQGKPVPEVARTTTGTCKELLQIGISPTVEPNRRRHVDGRMNGLEKRFLVEIVEPMVLEGTVKYWHFEGIKLRLADKTWWTPDFWLILSDGKVVAAEVKGHWEDDARVKVKIAAEAFPWLHIQAWMRDQKTKQWKREDF